MKYRIVIEAETPAAIYYPPTYVRLRIIDLLAPFFSTIGDVRVESVCDATAVAQHEEYLDAADAHDKATF